MEDTHRGLKVTSVSLNVEVLILVLMEDTHRDVVDLPAPQDGVLILVLMEDTHRE